MDKALKQRLVGATILIGLAIIFLPMLLDGEKPEGTSTQPIEVPQRPNVEFQTRRLPIGDQPEERAPPDTEPPATGNQPEVEISTINSPRASSRDIDETPPVADPPQPVPVASSSETQAASPVPVHSGTWLVQVGSFGSLENANRLSDQLAGLGYPALLEATAAGSELIRVKIGPFASETAADAAADRVRNAISGVTPSVLNGQGGELTTATPETGWVVQIGLFSTAENAATQSATLQQQGFSVTTDRQAAGGRQMWRVRTSALPERSQAEQLMDRIEARSGMKGIIKNLAEQ
nr:hypothetical protein [uncultured bacterium]